MEYNLSEKILFDSVIFDPLNKTFEILDGSIGVYRYEEIKRFAILNENAKYRGKQAPFIALLPGSGLSAGIFFPPLYVCRNQSCPQRRNNSGNLCFERKDNAQHRSIHQQSENR